MIKAPTTKELRKHRSGGSAQSLEATLPAKEAVHGLPGASDDKHVLIAQRAYELYLERGSRDGSALSDWLDAEREILGEVCHA